MYNDNSGAQSPVLEIKMLSENIVNHGELGSWTDHTDQQKGDWCSTSHLLEPPTDLETEYFNNDQVTTSVRVKDGGIRVSYTDTEKDYVTQRISSCADKYRNYLALTVPSDEESGDETSMQDEFKR